jgi:glycosyltransferase involved in cell wall biosynthesis
MINNQLKIAYLGNQIAWGGGAKSLLLLIKAVSNQGYKLYLFVTHCASQEMKKEFEKYVEFVKIVDLPEITSAQTQTIKDNIREIKEKKIDILKVKNFAEELNKLGIQILHINNSVFSGIYETIKKQTNVKIVSHIREWIDWNGIHQKQKFIINSISVNSDAIVCISDNEAQVFKNHNSLFVIPNPFDFQELTSILHDKKTIKTSLGIPENYFIVGMMGRAQENKGFLDFIKALAYLKTNYNDTGDIKFIILGGKIPSSFNIFKYTFKKIWGKSTFGYHVYLFLKKENLFNDCLILSNRKNALEVANIFDVAVRPSYSGDPWGRDIIEYMALKKPIVATGTSGFYINNGKTGFLVPSRNILQIAERIYWLYKNKNIGIMMGKKAYEEVNAKCNIINFRNYILHIYEALMSP